MRFVYTYVRTFYHTWAIFTIPSLNEYILLPESDTPYQKQVLQDQLDGTGVPNQNIDIKMGKVPAEGNYWTRFKIRLSRAVKHERVMKKNPIDKL